MGFSSLFNKNGNTDFRPVGDYRRLKAATTTKRDPIPKLNDVLVNLHGCHVFPRLIWSGFIIRYRWTLMIYRRQLFVLLLAHSNYCLCLPVCETQHVLSKGSLMRLFEGLILFLHLLKILFIASDTEENHHQHLYQLFQWLCNYGQMYIWSTLSWVSGISNRFSWHLTATF